jgi:N-methylhydantoinase A
MRYTGQSFQVDVRLPDSAVESADLSAMHAIFHKEHERIYNHCDPEAPVEFVDLRVRIRGAMSIPEPAAPSSSTVGDAFKGSRSMRFQGEIFPEARVFERSRLTHSDEVPGPAVIEQSDATLVVPPGFVARVGAYGTILMTRS